VHALGDGAQWIVNQVEGQFSCQAYFTVDFFHVCEYLAGAAPWWKTEEANAMLQLRTVRANGYWESYWRGDRAA
jgi:hypothetical protein